ncbi:MAG: YebC/PmpR family DNA-binding transcriptional regulator [Acidobacteria bacterium]|nr:YebC/PmpR family DNA-binding transcriptional regulator [Acidobacteriota bacterium]
MSGHSKWANIKHRKGAQDARRAKMFTKVGREITVAAKEGGGDPEMNARLRAAIAAARAVNMPNDNIERALKKGTGDAGGASFEEVVYEGYGPGGVAIHVLALTDNRNRTTPEIRYLFTRHGGDLASAGSVAWMFERKGYIEVPGSAITEEKLLDLVLDAGGDDLRAEEDRFEIYTSPAQFNAVREALERAGVPMNSAEISMIPQNLVPVDSSKSETLVALLEALDDHDDVQKVSANCELG